MERTRWQHKAPPSEPSRCIPLETAAWIPAFMIKIEEQTGRVSCIFEQIVKAKGGLYRKAFLFILQEN